jgi:recombination endonuclease VII
VSITVIRVAQSSAYAYTTRVLTKECRLCGESKPLGAFHHGHTKCKECRSRLAREEYAAGTSKTRSYDGVFEASLMRLYGLTMAGYEQMASAQGGLCAVCGQTEAKLRRNGLPYRLSVDHNRRTGQVRGLLCQRCNQIVWAFEEHAGLFAEITRYLDRFNVTQSD